MIAQLADAPLPPVFSVHAGGGPALNWLPLAAAKAPLPLGVTPQLTAPVGVTWFAPLSVTVTVHVVGLPTVTDVGVHVMAVVVGRNTDNE